MFYLLAAYGEAAHLAPTGKIIGGITGAIVLGILVLAGVYVLATRNVPLKSRTSEPLNETDKKRQEAQA